MAFCSKCGNQVNEGAVFCSACGSSVSAAGAPAIPPPPVEAASTGLSSNIAAALSYFFITGIIFLVSEQFKRDKFVRFHSLQAVAYGIVVTVFWIIWDGVIGGGSFLGGFFWVIFSLISTLVHLAIFIYWIFLMYKAYRQETYKIPVIGEWASKQVAK